MRRRYRLDLDGNAGFVIPAQSLRPTSATLGGDADFTIAEPSLSLSTPPQFSPSLLRL